MLLKNWIINLSASTILLLFSLEFALAHEIDTEVTSGQGGDFTLQSNDGPVSLEQFRGNVVLIFFGFTSCVDICPTTLATLSNAFSRLTNNELENVTALFISLDPDRDTTEVLKKYTGYFHSKIIGVTDRNEVLNKITKDYGVVFERKEKPDSPLGYVIYHTTDILVVDRKGNLIDKRIQITSGTEKIASDIKALLASNQ